MTIKNHRLNKFIFQYHDFKENYKTKQIIPVIKIRKSQHLLWHILAPSTIQHLLQDCLQRRSMQDWYTGLVQLPLLAQSGHNLFLSWQVPLEEERQMPHDLRQYTCMQSGFCTKMVEKCHFSSSQSFDSTTTTLEQGRVLHRAEKNSFTLKQHH